MLIFAHYLLLLVPLLLLGWLGWLLSLRSNNVTVVDSLWGMFFLVATVLGFYFFAAPSLRALIVLVLVVLWSCRLSIYLHLRNHGKAEDARYQAIRQRNQPNFRFKSLYLVFMLQAVLAWLLSSALFVSLQSVQDLNHLDGIALLLWLLGMSFQVVADAQLARFKAQPNHQNKVLSQGLWRYTRHPNYFGESCIWFAYGLFAVSAGYWWGILPSLVMTYLLVKVTGADLLEQEIVHRRPDYLAYMQSTNRFIPWFPKSKT